MTTGGTVGTPVSQLGTPTVDVSREGLPYATAVWVWDNSASAYVNNTLESQIPGGTAFTLFADTADYVYVGSQSKFDLIAFILTAAASVGTLTAQYYNGSWTSTAIRIPYNFDSSGAVSLDNLAGWLPFAFSAISPHVATPPDTTVRFWIRLSSSSASSPTVDRMILRPFARYCTPTDVYRALQLRQDFSAATNPTRDTVEQYIRRAQAHIEYVSRKSWTVNYQYQEAEQFNISGTRLLKRDIIAISKVEVWNGSSFDTLTEGRDSDYFFVNDTSMLYFSRYFLLPARMVASAPTFRWGWGEFNFPLRITYLWGRDLDLDYQGYLAQEIAIKKTAVDVFTTHDYSIIANSGVDRVSLAQKIESWRMEIEDKIESLRGWEVLS